MQGSTFFTDKSPVLEEYLIHSKIHSINLPWRNRALLLEIHSRGGSPIPHLKDYQNFLEGRGIFMFIFAKIWWETLNSALAVL
jgi:hypothetical protein